MSDQPSRTMRIAPLQTSDLPAMQSLFRQAFGGEMSEALHQWKYANGHGIGMGVWNEAGELIAHYGGLARSVLDAGQRRESVQIGDVMVAQAGRASLSRKGPFFLAASQFIDSYVGFGKQFIHGFGFPNQRAMTVADRLGLYKPVGKVVELEWESAGAALPWWLSLSPLHDPAQHAGALRRLWAAMAEDLRADIVGIRDLERLRYRYFEHPDQPYHCALLRHRLGGRAIGLVVLRHHGEHSEWLDLVAAKRHWASCALAARQLAAAAGARHLRMWVSESHQQLFPTPLASRDIDVIIPANNWSDGPSPDEQRNRWFLLGGDTDFR
ncbi:hypothetical protein [Chitinimonas sp.]|uniref:hypothetical protein n=1 Tax=Chitinimonas sp. TaxID=1934313 RepID=UPI0035B06921